MEIIIKALVFGAIFAYIGYSINKESVTGKLFFSKWMVWLGIACLSFALFMLYALLSGQVRDEIGQYIAIGLLIIFFGMGAIASFLEYKVTLGDYDDATISLCTPWSACKQCAWTEIDTITYNDSMHWYVFHCKNGIKMRFSSYLTGINELVAFAEKQNIVFKT